MIQREEKNVNKIRNIISEVNIMVEEVITIDEVKKIKNEKAAGCDEVVGEFIKSRGENLVTSLHMFTGIMETVKVPDECRETRVELIHKGGGKDRKKKLEIPGLEV